MDTRVERHRHRRDVKRHVFAFLTKGIFDVPLMSVVHIHSALKGGLMAYPRGWAWQQLILNRRLEYLRSGGDEHTSNLRSSHHDFLPENDSILLIEHEPVYTLGSGSNEANLTFLKGDDQAEQIKARLSKTNRGVDSARLSVDRLNQSVSASLLQSVDNFQPTTSVRSPSGVPIYRVERGGQVTFHGPGMLVVYPLLDLRRNPYKQDLHWYLRSIEEVIIKTLQRYNIVGTRDEINSGVWVGKDKIAAVGVSASRWITTHGFAINVCPDLAYFDTSVIIPCGIAGRGVTSMAKELTIIPSIASVADTTMDCFQQVFGVSSILSMDIA